jgi:ribose-phosphate pyrophosphokinase
MSIKLLNGDYKTSKFPGGEIHVQVIVCPRKATIHADLKTSDDIMLLLMLCDAIKNMGCRLENLEILYLPYARQDRICRDGEAFSLRVFAGLINNLNAANVVLYVPHSDVSTALINNCEVLHLDELISEAFIEGKILVCPDAGAEKRTMRFKRPYIMATKIRDYKTGDIISTQIYADRCDQGTYLIVDDICDGGRTFIELAKVLKAKGANRVELFVAHGIFSAGMSVFEGLIDQIYWNNENGFNIWKE